ncbi:LCP family protein [Caldinitratiruptor microaerophilus]|uniref:Cell envelope-related transcriptional attenuator domain-containing protein n=1 Tax=Caldinitratiruptor microaerophilus TaxID=671077 RepID=A0AA35G9H7_9FIRM|nr:LCP family protein [Caldinitratiruptor microaerophilus]BDG61473.1 hypothetical protein caldi_25630 [Caldinitratiruptor microaerophilus]
MKGSRSGWYVVTAVALVIALSIAGAAARRLFGFGGRVGVRAGAEARAEGPSAPSPARLGRTTVLILGVDDRKDSKGRSDTVLVAAVHPKDRVLTLISLPRDTLVEIPGRGYDKLAHAYAYGGTELALATVERMLDIPIDHYARLDFQGFEKIVDALGGIDVNIPKRMYYVDPYDDNGGLVIDFKPGPQHLNGEQALKYARFRHDEEGDWGRMRRQQEVVKLLLDKALSPSVVVRLPGLVRSLYQAVDTDLGLGQLLDFAMAGKEVAQGSQTQGPHLQTLVAGGNDRYLHGVYYLIPDLVKLRTEAYRMLLGAEPPARFLEKAREDQAELEAVVRRWAAQDRGRQEAEKARQAQEAAKAKAGAGEPGSPSEAGNAGRAAGQAPPAAPGGDGAGSAAGSSQAGAAAGGAAGIGTQPGGSEGTAGAGQTGAGGTTGSGTNGGTTGNSGGTTGMTGGGSSPPADGAGAPGGAG